MNTFTSNDFMLDINISNTSLNSESNSYYNYLISLGYSPTQALNEVKTYYALRPLYLL